MSQGWKRNFRQYGATERIRDVESQKNDDTGVRRDRKVAKHFVFPVLCGSGGWKNRFAQAAGAETAGQLSNEKAHAVVARSKGHNNVS